MHCVLGAERSIPAWAGETDPTALLELVGRVYPRVGGGNGGLSNPMNGAMGLSPRGRGKREDAHIDQDIAGSIPAWAGETTALP